MEQDLERIQSRLANIRSVSPILAALRTISLGSWQMALNRRKVITRYSARLLDLLPVVLPLLPAKHKPDYRLLKTKRKQSGHNSPPVVEVLVIGSERGLCGRFNTTILGFADTYLRALDEEGAEVQVIALGAKAIHSLRRADVPLRWSHSLPVTALPSFDLAFTLTRDWLTRYETYALDRVDILYAAYDGAGQYTPTAVHIIPPRLPIEIKSASREAYPTTIVDTDPLHLYTRIVEQWAAIRMYSLLLTSAASEHSARFQLMESATQNADAIAEELMLALQSARRRAITREMQELAVGAGLLDLGS